MNQQPGHDDDDAAQPTYTVPWARLRAWIDEKQSWEAQHGRPAPLTDQELTAISQLVPFIDQEPSFGDKDYISEVQRYIQAKRLNPLTWSEDEVKTIVDGHFQTRWRYFCTLDGFGGEFPRQGYGITAEGEAPAFQSKKKAKQFASQQLLAFLAGGTTPAASSPITTNRGTATETDGPSTPSKRQRLSSSLSQTGTHNTPRSPDRLLPKADLAAAVTTSRDRERDKDRVPTVFDCVRRLAEDMGLENPTYDVQPDPELPNLWTGGAVFKPGSRIPDGLGAVRQVLGKQEARAQAAHEVLAWLQGEKARREAAMLFLRELAPRG